MSQKVWFIDDPAWDITPGTTQVEPAPLPRQAQSPSLPRSPQKNPAWSFSLSLLLWGSGQLYVREYGRGALFMAANLLFYGAVPALVFCREAVSRVWPGREIPPPLLGLAALVLVLAGLSVWLVNAVDAYGLAAQRRSEPFGGVEHAFWPGLGSLLLPGWGQFLNAQPRKGICFLLAGGIGLFAGFFLSQVPSLWPLLHPGWPREVVECGLLAALGLISLALLLWMVAVYDAFHWGRERLRSKQRGLNPAASGGRRRGLGQALLPSSSAILGLLLATSVGIQCLPRDYYLGSLATLRSEMLSNHMEILPGWVEKVMEWLRR